ncbi:MAG TPA: DNA recombination protein RmuC [Gammaproteobacteria bacterium]|nr:DNA recombination protein RmuC [Gammaproteobacteria bacterium]
MLVMLLAGLMGLIVGAVVVFWRLERRHQQAMELTRVRTSETTVAEKQLMDERLQFRERNLLSTKAELKELQKTFDELIESSKVASADVVRLSTVNAQQSEDLSKLRREIIDARSEAGSSGLKLAEFKTRLEETERAFAEKEALFRQTGESLKQEFQLLANQIFEKQGEVFRVRNEAHLSTVLAPFKTQLTDFRQKVDQVYTTDAKDRASLLTEVRNLQRASEKVNEEAENLTRALKGDKRLQGNWGELVLERVLEESGLRKDHEYILQHSLRNADGDIKRPDVIIHLPENKDVVVDAKVSLIAYETAVSSDDDAAREVAIKRHVQSVRTHVNKLSEQSYDQLPGIRSLDFVLLFVPVESAFTLAMEKDPSLFTEAFEKRLVIVSPTTLMMTLRIIDNVWRYEKQNKNAQEIARRAGALYDKLRVVLEDMDQLGRNLDQASRSYDSAFARLAKGRGNLVRQVEQFRELGATVKRSIPQEIVDEADD